MLGKQKSYLSFIFVLVLSLVTIVTIVLAASQKTRFKSKAVFLPTPTTIPIIAGRRLIIAKADMEGPFGFYTDKPVGSMLTVNYKFGQSGTMETIEKVVSRSNKAYPPLPNYVEFSHEDGWPWSFAWLKPMWIKFPGMSSVSTLVLAWTDAGGGWWRWQSEIHVSDFGADDDNSSDVAIFLHAGYRTRYECVDQNMGKYERLRIQVVGGQPFSYNEPVRYNCMHIIKLPAMTVPRRMKISYTWDPAPVFTSDDHCWIPEGNGWYKDVCAGATPTPTPTPTPPDVFLGLCFDSCGLIDDSTFPSGCFSEPDRPLSCMSLPEFPLDFKCRNPNCPQDRDCNCYN